MKIMQLKVNVKSYVHLKYNTIRKFNKKLDTKFKTIFFYNITIMSLVNSL